MKNLFFGLLLMTSIVPLSYASKITCEYDEDGYYKETIELNIHKNKITDLKYTDFMGDTLPFVKIAKNTYEYTDDSLIIKHQLRFGTDFKSATMTVSYKDGDEEFKTMDFICQEN